MLTVRDLMAPDPITIAPEDTLRDVADVLTSAGVSGAPVVSGGLVIGVVTLSDILSFEVDSPPRLAGRPEMQGLEPGEEPNLDDANGTAEPASHWFINLWDAEGADAVTRMEESEGPGWNSLDEHTVAEVMTRAIVHVDPAMPVAEAARILAREKIHRLLVLEAGAAVGIITTVDMVLAIARGELVPADEAAKASTRRPAAATPRRKGAPAAPAP